jgi:organic radical activating enzyme
LIVLTGGEPLRQPIGKFIERALDSSWRVQIETAGTVWPESMYSDSVQRRLHEGSLVLVCSPKTGRVHAQIERWCRHFKYITCAADDGPITAVRESTQTRGLRAKLYVPFNDATIWLQPRMDYTPTGAVDTVATEANTQQAVRLCMRYGYRLSLQTHKLLGVE